MNCSSSSGRRQANGFGVIGGHIHTFWTEMRSGHPPPDQRGRGEPPSTCLKKRAAPIITSWSRSDRMESTIKLRSVEP